MNISKCIILLLISTRALISICRHCFYMSTWGPKTRNCKISKISLKISCLFCFLKMNLKLDDYSPPASLYGLNSRYLFFCLDYLSPNESFYFHFCLPTLSSLHKSQTHPFFYYTPAALASSLFLDHNNHALNWEILQTFFSLVENLPLHIFWPWSSLQDVVKCQREVSLVLSAPF